MKSNFDKCLQHVLREEGGYVNHPTDPGGETNMGISKRAYPNENIKGMTVARASQIYKRDYWDRVRGDDLPSGLDMIAFDGAVNSGVSRGAKWLQSAVGVTADGKVGPATLAAANAANARAAIGKGCDARLAFLRSLGTWPTFGRGWTARVERVRATALSMASAAPATSPRPPAKPDIGNPITPRNPFAALIKAIAAIFGRRK